MLKINLPNCSLITLGLLVALGLAFYSPSCFAAEVLSPKKFSGKVAAGYKAAQDAKETCSKLFCYCGCDLTDKHISLLDCFTSMHGMGCAICIDEAIVARHMKEQGKSLAQIQNTIDDGFMPQYPWVEPSSALKLYLERVKIDHKHLGTAYSTNSRKAKHAGNCCQHKK